MKHILTLISLLLLNIGTAHAQAPQGIPYQAAARSSTGAILASTPISVRFSIRDSIATGTIKYRETHTVTTDANGIFSLVMGQGTPISGTFAAINWGTNAKFQQVEMDPAGGSSFTDMGPTQMMSVPYALHAGSLKLTASTSGDTLYSGGGNYVIVPGVSVANCLVSAGTITGAATVCLGATTPFSNVISGGSWSSSSTGVATVNSSGVVTGIATGTATISYTVTISCGSAVTTKVVTVNTIPTLSTITGTATLTEGTTTSLGHATAGGTWSSSATVVATVGTSGTVTGISLGTATISYSVTHSCGVAVATRVVTVNAPIIAIGNSYRGGKIAYIYQPGDIGYVAGETHGIIAALSDLGTAQWGCIETFLGGTSRQIGTGAANTALISPACGAGSAARLCADLVQGGYDDWYLPSSLELNKLYISRFGLGGFNTGYYFSSSEETGTYAWDQSFHVVGYINITYKHIPASVRPVRAF